MGDLFLAIGNVFGINKLGNSDRNNYGIEW